MIVPRSFTSHGISLSEKAESDRPRSRSPTQSRSRSRSQSRTRNTSTSPFNLSPVASKLAQADNETRSSPVQIPTRTPKDLKQRTSPATSIPSQVHQTEAIAPFRDRHGSAQELLSSMAIPARRKIRGRASQRLPKGDHVAEFSKLLLEDVTTKDGSPARSFSSSDMDALFGHIDELVEGQMIVGSDGLDESILVTRSISSESLTSLASPDDYGSSGFGSHRSSLGRSYELKRMRQSISSRDCATDHPLLPTETSDEPTTTPPLPVPTQATASVEKKPRSFKSSLTASLKAIKSAAQSVSSKATLFTNSDSEDYLARSFFDIQPWLTDDKRPPPANNPPSPQLRRYLNPYSADSPAQLHFWQDERYADSQKQSKKLKSKSRRKNAWSGTLSSPSIDSLPPIVQLSTCLPPSIRTANASSPPIWLNPDGTPTNKQTADPLLQDPAAILENAPNQPRHREPRENRDFLRIFVCEMEMRRNGKLSDDTSTGRARLWLPPVATDSKGNSNQTSASTSGEATELVADTTGGSSRRAEERWRSWTADDL